MGWKDWQDKTISGYSWHKQTDALLVQGEQTVTQGYKTGVMAQKGKSRVVCDREGGKKKKKRLFVWDRLRRLTRQVKSKSGSKMRKVEVATQKGRVKIHLDWKWGERGENTTRRKSETFLQASNDNPRRHTWGPDVWGVRRLVNMVGAPP